MLPQVRWTTNSRWYASAFRLWKCLVLLWRNIYSPNAVAVVTPILTCMKKWT